MRVEDEPSERFYPVCCDCGCAISGEGFLFHGDYYCADCFDYREIDGQEEAEERRYSAFEDAQEHLYV